MNAYDLLMRNLQGQDVRNAPTIAQTTALCFTDDCCIVRQQSDFNVVGNFTTNDGSAGVTRRWLWQARVAKFADLMRLSTFTHFADQDIMSIHIVAKPDIERQPHAYLQFHSLQQLQEFYIPQVALMACSVELQVLSRAPPTPGGKCCFESYFLAVELRETMIPRDSPPTAPRFWPVCGKQLLCTHQGFGYNVPQML
jgi:hypothetical protein